MRSTGLHGALAVVTLIVMVPLIRPDPVWSAASMCDGNWEAVATAPQPLYGVDAIAANDVWAVGYAGLIEHWNGTRWRAFKAPTPGPDRRLYAVSLSSATEGWAVGAVVKHHLWKSLLEHWDGSYWTVVAPGDNQAGNDNFRFGVATAGPASAVAVGVLEYGNAYPSILTWNGSRWSMGGSDAPDGSFAAATIPPSGHFWSVGFHNGKVLVDGPGGGLKFPGELDGVSGTSDDDLWAVGSMKAGSDHVVHWDGTAWKIVRDASGSTMDGVAAVAPDLVLAVGDGPVAETWNGSRWKLRSITGMAAGTLRAVSALPTGEAWAVGDDGTGGMILHECPRLNAASVRQPSAGRSASQDVRAPAWSHRTGKNDSSIERSPRRRYRE
jgi:hypothetical protein